MIEEIEPGIGFSVVQLGHPGIPELVFGRRCLAEHGLEIAHDVLGFVLPPVEAQGILALGPAFENVFQFLKFRRGNADIPGPDVEQKTVVRRALNIGFTTERIDTTACDTDIAQQQLNDGHRPNDLNADGVLGPPHGVENGSGLIRFPGGSKGFVNGQQIRFARTGDRGDGLQVIARIMLLQLIEYTKRILQAHIPFGLAVCIELESPFRLVV